MKVTRKLFFLLLLSMSFTSIFAQDNIEVIGKIVDSDNFELIGVTVAEKGTTNAVMTNVDGMFKIKVPKTATLNFTYLGMKPKSEVVNNRNIINVVLESAYIELDEVVAVGYGTVRRGELTSSIASVSGKDIEKLPVTDALQALSGRVAGLHITRASGAPGARSDVKIRGGISITQSNEPLYIVDGFPSPEGLSIIEPSDIETIDVMKDASAAAIYGAAGANGVILITTKTGSEGKATINFDAYLGIKKINRRLDLLNAEDFVRQEYERSMLVNNNDDRKKFANVYGSGWNDNIKLEDNMQNSWYDIPQYYRNRAGIDWQDEIFDSRTPVTQNYRVSVSGGTKETKYNASFSHINDDGIMTDSGFLRNNIRIRFDQKITDKIKFNVTASYVEDKVSGQGGLEDGGRFSAMRQIIQYRPVMSRDGNDRDLIDLDIDPLLEEESGNVLINPITAIEAQDRDRRNQVTTFNANVKYEIIKGLTYDIQGSMRKRTSKNDVFYHARSREAARSGGPFAQISKQIDNSWSYTNTLTYRPKFSKRHHVDVMLGQEEKYRKFDNLAFNVMNFDENNHGLNDLSMGMKPTVPSTSVQGERDLSIFGRVNYNFDRKYMFTFIYRLDGSTKFGKNNRWGHFPSASFAWRAIDEKFIKDLNTFSDLKVRFGVGTAGNNNIGRYRSQYRLRSGIMGENNTEVNSVYQHQLANPNLKWETDISINLGFELGFFDQRLQAVIDIYQNTAKDLLLERQLPWATGFASVLQNVGKTENKGIEIALNSFNIDTKNFKWSSGFNISYNRNEVKKLANTDIMRVRSAWAGSSDYNDYDYLLEVGSALGQMWGWAVDGIYQVDDFDYNETTQTYTLKKGVVTSPDQNVKPGYWKYKDIDKNGEIDNNDRHVIGRASPRFYGGITNNMSYRDFDFSFIMNYSLGGQIYNANKMFYTKIDPKHKNSLALTKDRFTYINEKGENVFSNPTELARINQNATWTSIDGNSTLRFNSNYIEGASFLRLSNVTLGYTLPTKLTKKFYVSKLRFYASANNLFTIAGYTGYDPEVNTKPNSGLTPGIDWGAYPRALTMIFGANITF